MTGGGLSPSVRERTRLRRLVQDGPRPTVLRLSDEAETALNLARPSELGKRRRRMPGDRRVRGKRRRSGLASGGRVRRVRRRRVRRPCRTRARSGRGTAIAGPTCATRCSTRAPSSRRSRRSRSGRRCRGCTGGDHGAARVTVCPGGAAGGGVSHLARLRVGSVAVLHRRLRAARRSGRAVAQREGGRRRRDPRRGRIDHPPPWSRARSPRVVRARDRRARSRGAGRGQGPARSRGHPQSGHPDSARDEPPVSSAR